MATYIKVSAGDVVINGTQYLVPDTYVELKDATTGFDGPGSYHVQLATGGGITPAHYIVSYGLKPCDTSTRQTICRVVQTPSGQLIFSDARNLNVTVAAVNNTIAHTAFSDGSYLQTGVVTVRTIAAGTIDGAGGLLDQIGAAEGDILYRGASAWLALAPGTSGDVLTTGGSSAAPSWAPAGGSSTPIVPSGTSFPGSPTSGQLFYRTDLLALFWYNGSAWKNADSVASLNDVTLTSPANGDVLTYDSGSSTWKNQALSSGGVASLQTLTGALSLTSPDSSVTIGTSGSDITLEAVGGGGSVTEEPSPIQSNNVIRNSPGTGGNIGDWLVPPTSGSLLIFWGCAEGSPTTPSGWTLAHSNGNVVCYTRTANGTSTDNFVAGSSTGSNWVGFLLEFASATLTGFASNTNTFQQGSFINVIVTPSFTAASSKRQLVLAAFYSTGGNPFGAISAPPWVAPQVSAVTGNHGAIAYAIAPAGGTVRGSMLYNTSGSLSTSNASIIGVTN